MDAEQSRGVQIMLDLSSCTKWQTQLDVNCLEKICVAPKQENELLSNFIYDSTEFNDVSFNKDDKGQKTASNSVKVFSELVEGN